MKLEILSINYHRNGSGVCEGFVSVIFKYKSGVREGITKSSDWLATFNFNGESEDMNPESLRINNISVLEAQWRGDHFIDPLQSALKSYCKGLGIKYSWSAACFPKLQESKL